jgi:hypothetical protein
MEQNTKIKSLSFGNIIKWMGNFVTFANKIKEFLAYVQSG